MSVWNYFKKKNVFQKCISFKHFLYKLFKMKTRVRQPFSKMFIGKTKNVLLILNYNKNLSMETMVRVSKVANGITGSLLLKIGQ